MRLVKFNNRFYTPTTPYGVVRPPLYFLLTGAILGVAHGLWGGLATPVFIIIIIFK
jgi:protein-S-isoprenylcysteine O-methyltransferase Ste14